MRCRLQAGSQGGGSATVWREARCPGPCLARAPSRHLAGQGQGPAGASQKSASSKTVTSLDTAAQGCGGAGPRLRARSAAGRWSAQPRVADAPGGATWVSP